MIPTTGPLADPTFRRERARNAAKARTGVDYYIRKLLASAPRMTAEDRVRIAQILFAPDGGAK